MITMLLHARPVATRNGISACLRHELPIPGQANAGVNDSGSCDTAFAYFFGTIYRIK